MLRARTLALLLVTLLALSPAHAGKKRKFTLGERPEQSVAVTGVPDAIAEQPCANFAFAASMESILRLQNVTTLDQRFWVQKLNGDLTCRPIASYEDLQRIVEGDYTVGINRHVRLTVRYTNALPATTDELLVPLSQQRPYILMYKSMPHLVTGAAWHEMYFQTGQKIIELTHLTLIDPTGRDAEHTRDFTRDKDPVSDLGGLFDVSVTEIDIDNWKR